MLIVKGDGHTVSVTDRSPVRPVAVRNRLKSFPNGKGAGGQEWGCSCRQSVVWSCAASSDTVPHSMAPPWSSSAA